MQRAGEAQSPSKGSVPLFCSAYSRSESEGRKIEPHAEQRQEETIEHGEGGARILQLLCTSPLSLIQGLQPYLCD